MSAIHRFHRTHASFYLWWMENLLIHQKASKYYDHDCEFQLLKVLHPFYAIGLCYWSIGHFMLSDRQNRTSKIKMHFARVSYSPKHRYIISIIFILNTPWLVIFFIYIEFLINLIQFKLENLSFDFRRTFFYHLIIELVLKLHRKSRSKRFKDKIIKLLILLVYPS